MKIEKGRRVRLKIKLEVEGGDVLEQSVVEFFCGAGTMLPGIEQELEGLEKGAKKSGVVKAENAFGSPAHQPEKTISKKEFPEDAEFEVGQQFAAAAENGQNVILEVQKVETDSVTVKYLHPLAKKNIAYDFEVLSVTDPSPPPLPADAVASEDD